MRLSRSGDISVEFRRFKRAKRGALGSTAAGPLLFQLRASMGEAVGELVHDVRHQSIGGLYALAGIVDEAGLHVIPSRAQARQIVGGEKYHLR
ncbi:MAG: hypothetical protein QOJ80_82 [Mycobacterium sp.]|nr:hypothetical protein [Mycobacterium sp.]